MSRRVGYDSEFIPMFFKIVIGVSLVSAGVVYWLAQGTRVVVITKTKVEANPVVDYFWPVLLLGVLGAVFVCSVTGLMLYSFLKKKIKKPSSRLQGDLQRMAMGDFSRGVEFWNAEDVRDVAVDLEKTREALKNKLVLLNDRYNAIKNFLDQKNFEVNGQNRDLLKQKLQSVDELFKGFQLRPPTVSANQANQHIVSIELQPDKIVKDAEEMVKT